MRQLTKALLLSRKKKIRTTTFPLKTVIPSSKTLLRTAEKTHFWQKHALPWSSIYLTPSAFPPAPPQDSRAGQQGRAVPPTPAGVAAPAPARQRPPQRAPLRSVPLRSPAVPPPPLSAAPRPTGLPPFPSGSREAYRSRCPHTDTPTAAAPPSARRKRPPTPQPSAALPARLRPLLGAHRGAERRRRGVGPRAPPGGRRPRGVKAAGAAAERGPLGWAVALGLAGRCACSPKKMCNKVAPE